MFAAEKRLIEPIKTISGEVRLPGSKSLSNRALLLAALAEGTTVVENLLVCASVCSCMRMIRETACACFNVSQATMPVAAQPVMQRCIGLMLNKECVDAVPLSVPHRKRCYTPLRHFNLQ